MELSDIQHGLSCFTEKLTSQTYLNTYRIQDRSSLLVDGIGTRANSIWKMANYIVAIHEETAKSLKKKKAKDSDKVDPSGPDVAIEIHQHTKDEYLQGWKDLCKNYKNQFLFLEVEIGQWEMYDYDGKCLGNEEYIEEWVTKMNTFNTPKQGVTYLQQIYYGAPGTGKSNEIKKMTAEGGMFTKDCTFRTTFHPDSDYTSFVGAYKPYWDKAERKIVYSFRPQSFLKAYIKAWKNPEKNVALVVEEINRGNCAQIFGDIFQLLDREKDGLSKYPIECDVEMQELLAEEFSKATKEFGAAISDNTYAGRKESINNYYSAHYDNAFDKIKNGEILALPMNLSILATMNTSDQSLFPMDSAFKRRWEWIYTPIKNGQKNWMIEVGNVKTKDENGNEIAKCLRVDWWKFLEKINEVIFRLTDSEDKQLGYHFIHLEDDKMIIDNETFVGKVIFYLWNDVFKDYGYDPDCCKSKDKKEKVSFAKFYKNDSSELEVDAEVLKVFFEQLGFGTEKDMEFETTPETDNAETQPVAPAPAIEEGQPENNTEGGSEANETGDVQSAELFAEPAQEVNDEASNDATGEASMNPDETTNG